jgi:Na+-driven multidrug efflux pump
MRIQLSDHFTYKRLFAFTLPSVAMMVFTSIYGIVDGFFVSNFAGEIPFKAINLIFPFLMILGTVGFMFGTGGTAIVAKVFGEGDKEKANEYFSLFVYVTFMLGCIFALTGILFLPSIAKLLGAKGVILEDCISYGRIILCALPFLVLQYIFQSFFVAAEKPKLGLGVIIAAGITNMVLDAILVLLLPKKYKLIGAAIATAGSQLVGGVVPLIYFFRENGSILRLGKTRWNGKILLRACVNGSSEFMSNVSMNLVGMLYNWQLLKYAGEDGVAAYGTMMYAGWIFCAVFVGYSIGCAPIISYNDGANNREELKGILKKSLIIIGALGLLMVAIGELFAWPLSAIFVGYSDAIMDMTVHGFRLFAICFPFMGYAIFGSNFFTALNDGLTSAVISFLRTLVFQLIAVLTLPLVWGLDGIWISVVVAEFVAATLSGLCIVLKRKRYGI